MTEVFNPKDNLVFCRKYQTALPRMNTPPFPNSKGQELYDTVSAKAWGEWLNLQTMLINEHHLSLFDKSAKEFLNSQREKFLDNLDYEKPKGYKPL